MLSIDDLEGLERALAATPTRLVVFESPTNPVLKIADIERLTSIARRHGALTLLDNTLAGFHNHGQFDVDLFAHSLTKYASGHGDVMGGAVIGRAELIDSMRGDMAILGPTLDPHAAFLLQRGMKTYFVRWDAQCRNALRVAEHLARHPRVERVRYPGLPGDPGHALALRQMPDFGTIVTIDVAGGEASRVTVRRAAGVVFDRRESRVDRVTGRAPGPAGHKSVDSRAAALGRHRSGYRATVHRPRRRRRPHRGPRERPRAA